MSGDAGRSAATGARAHSTSRRRWRGWRGRRRHDDALLYTALWSGPAAPSYILSRNFSSAGMLSLRPLRLRMTETTTAGRLPASNGFPGSSCQWSKTHCGNAWPPVLERRSAVKPATDSGGTASGASTGRTTDCDSVIDKRLQPTAVLLYLMRLLRRAFYFRFPKRRNAPEVNTLPRFSKLTCAVRSAMVP